jgi:glycosyltransferase involved in cell wall biosynthesis
MKLCFLANAQSIHTRRWTTYFSQNGHDVTVLSLSKGEIPGVDVRWIGLEPGMFGRLAYLAAALPVRMAIRALRPDVLHSLYAGGYGFLGALAGFHPFIVSAWGSDVLVVPQVEPRMKRVIRGSLGKADLITSESAHMTASIRALGITQPILNIPAGADTAIFHPDTKLGSKPEAPPLIVSTRHLEPVYNVRLLIDALPEILKVFPTATAAIIGDGSMRRELECRTTELGIEKSVCFLGRLSPPEVADYLCKADVFVSTSLSDGNNISLKEAMACGTFPVVTNIPVNREWIQQGLNGFLVDTLDPRDLANHVIEGIESPALRSSAADLNREHGQPKASWKAAMTLVEAEYQALVDRRVNCA